MAADPENTLIIETTKGSVVIALRPTSRPSTSSASRSWRAKASTTASSSTASSTASWRRPAARKAPAPAAPSYPQPQRRVQRRAARARRLLDGALAERPTAPTASSSSCSTTPPSSTSSTRRGARSSRAWRTSTRSSAASRSEPRQNGFGEGRRPTQVRRVHGAGRKAWRRTSSDAVAAAALVDLCRPRRAPPAWRWRPRGAHGATSPR